MSERELEKAGPLDEREIALARRILSDPFSFPAEFWTAVKARLSNDPPELTWDSIIGFNGSAERAVPAKPLVDLAVDISAANTDLPRPGSGFHHVWMVNPGGGSLRTIGEPVSGEGTRLTLKGGFIGTTTLKHNDLSGPGGFARPLFLHGAADLALTDTESIDLVYVDTTWQDVARVETVSTGLAQVIANRTTPAVVTSGAYGTMVAQTELEDDWAGWAPGTGQNITLVQAGVYVVGFNARFSGGSGGTVRSGVRIAHYNSGSVFQAYLAEAESAVLNGAYSLTGILEAAANDFVQFHGMSQASGTPENWEGRIWATKIA